jgi:hypothetical protein
MKSYVHGSLRSGPTLVGIQGHLRHLWNHLRTKGIDVHTSFIMSVLRYLLPMCVATLCGCVGFRTPLDDCPVEGQTESCSNTCGKGTRTCMDGRWSTCQVPPAELPCSDTCGKGTQHCEDNVLKGVCQVAPVVVDCTTVCGPGTQTCANNKQGACTAPQPKQPRLTALIRDFHNSFPDMDHPGVAETGIVASALGSDDKPVYAHSGATATVVGPDTFNQWYRDVDGINTSTTLNIPLAPSTTSKGVYGYSNTVLFPHRWAALRQRRAGPQLFLHRRNRDQFPLCRRRNLYLFW